MSPSRALTQASLLHHKLGFRGTPLFGEFLASPVVLLTLVSSGTASRLNCLVSPCLGHIELGRPEDRTYHSSTLLPATGRRTCPPLPPLHLPWCAAHRARCHLKPRVHLSDLTGLHQQQRKTPLPPASLYDQTLRAMVYQAHHSKPIWQMWLAGTMRPPMLLGQHHHHTAAQNKIEHTQRLFPSGRSPQETHAEHLQSHIIPGTVRECRTRQRFQMRPSLVGRPQNHNLSQLLAYLEVVERAARRRNAPQ